VVLPIAKGEFVLPLKLAGENAGYGLPSLIPPGMRAVSVRVNEVVSERASFCRHTGGCFAHGKSVRRKRAADYDCAGERGRDRHRQRLERNAAGDPQSTPVITLLVSPDDAQKLTLASTQGRIQLALRNPLDTKQQDLASMRTNSLYKNVLLQCRLCVKDTSARRSNYPGA